MLNVGKARELCELLVKKDVNPVLFWELMNIKLREFADRTGVLESSATLNSVASTYDYQLPSDCLHVSDVIYDGYRAQKATTELVKELAGKV